MSQNNSSNNSECIQGNNKQPMVYIGLCSKFKERYNNHTLSFRNAQHETKTELSKYIWQLKRSNTAFRITWKIMQETPGYNNISKRCSLCLAEKFQICNFKEKERLLNKKNELISKCRHENAFTLKYYH